MNEQLPILPDYLSRAGKTLLIIVITVSALSIAMKMKPRVIYIIDPNYIPSVMEIQQRLKDLDDPRYDPGKVDGIPGPKTIRGWDNHTCDRFAKGE